MAEAGEAETQAVSSDYVRVKRKKTTIFLYVDQTDTSHDLRAKVNLITKVPVSDIKFFLDRNGELPIDEHKSLADMKARAAHPGALVLCAPVPFAHTQLSAEVRRQPAVGRHGTSHRYNARRSTTSSARPVRPLPAL